MRLLTLFIKDYKNIHDQSFDFTANTGYIALIGLNGSGKSNLLEAISLIFDDIYGLSHNGSVNGYTISYDIDGTSYTYTTLDAENNVIPLAQGAKVGPSSVIACYSGEDLRLWHMAYEDYYMQYFRNAIHDNKFTPQIIYINKYCWKIAFISLLCSSNAIVKEFLKNILSINDIKTVDIHFEADSGKRAIFVDHSACKWFDSIQALQNDNPNQWVNANEIATKDMMTFGAKKAEAPDYLFHFLYLLSLPEKNTAKGQTIDKLITDITITINGITFDNLSEGEKKLILIECITQILGDEKSLILLDEPDVHVHIEYKKKLLEAIKSFNGQTVFTTHSPILANLIQKDNSNNIILLKDGKIENIGVINKLLEISGEELDFINSSVVVGSKYILVVEGISDVRCINKAIEVWSGRDPKYKKLESVKLLSAGGTGDVKEIFTEVLFPQIDYIDKIVYLFDVDKAGTDGYKKIEDDLKNDAKYSMHAGKIESLYYKNDLSKNFELEDLFPPIAYDHIVKKVHALNSYRDFKNNQTRAVAAIKDHIKEKASTFQDSWYNGFQPLLDELLKVFGL